MTNPTDILPKILAIITQVYPPEPASGGQYVAEVAEEMARRGWQVVVYTANRGYEDTNQRFPSSELVRGVRIIRVPFSSFGKASILHRITGQFLFLLQSGARVLFRRRLTTLLITTSPPLSAMSGVIIRLFRRVKLKFWAMDINPDQAVAMGKFKPNAFPVRLLDWLNRRLLAQASDIVALDSYMARRLQQKRPEVTTISVIPPWPHEDHLTSVIPAENPFIVEHSLGGKFVFMYSGNHSVVHPLTTLLEVALQREKDDTLRFVFIGGGKGKEQVEDIIAKRRPRNILSLPYQPLDRIKYSLSAADVHVVAMGNEMVGCVHPSKIYAAMALAKPILFLGPTDSHIGELMERFQIGWQVDHGDEARMRVVLDEIRRADPAELAAMGLRASEAVRRHFGKPELCGGFCDLLEK